MSPDWAGDRAREGEDWGEGKVGGGEREMGGGEGETEPGVSGVRERTGNGKA